MNRRMETLHKLSKVAFKGRSKDFKRIGLCEQDIQELLAGKIAVDGDD